MSKTLKTIIAALVLTTATVTLAANSYAAPRTQQQQGPSEGERNWMDHASQNVDGGGD